MSRMTRSVAFALLGLAAAVGQANFVLVEDFETLQLGPIDDQDGWSAADETSVVGADPAALDNQILLVATDSTHLHRPMYVLNGTVRMVFLRFRYADQLNFSYGLSDHTFPDQFGDFEVELSMTNASDDLRINDDGMYEVLATLQPNVWYNVWILVDNVDDTSQVWLHARSGDAATDDDRLDADGQAVFGFRDGTAGDLVTFFIKTGGGSGPSGPLLIDDLYVEDTSALNLSNPTAYIPTPGDLNCDGAFDFGDINPFVLALSNPAAYASAYPDCDIQLGDINADGAVDLRDINPFVVLLTGGG